MPNQHENGTLISQVFLMVVLRVKNSEFTQNRNIYIDPTSDDTNIMQKIANLQLLYRIFLPAKILIAKS